MPITSHAAPTGVSFMSNIISVLPPPRAAASSSITNASSGAAAAEDGIGVCICTMCSACAAARRHRRFQISCISVAKVIRAVKHVAVFVDDGFEASELALLACNKSVPLLLCMSTAKFESKLLNASDLYDWSTKRHDVKLMLQRARSGSHLRRTHLTCVLHCVWQYLPA